MDSSLPGRQGPRPPGPAAGLTVETGRYTKRSMRPVRALVLISSALALSAACTSGQTQVQGLPEVTETSRPTGPTATGPTAATGVTGATGDAFSLVFDIPPAAADFISEAAFFTCDGLEGTWRYIFQADFGSGIALAIDTTVDMEGGDGTMVFGGELSPEGFAGTLTFQDTVELSIRGTPDAPALVATSVEVSVSGNLEGVPVSVFETFQENDQLPIVPGSDRC
jgi:hypothetical protein